MVAEYKDFLHELHEGYRYHCATPHHRSAVCNDPNITLVQKERRSASYNHGYGLPHPVPIFDDAGIVQKILYVYEGTVIPEVRDLDTDLSAIAAKLQDLDIPVIWDEEDEDDKWEDSNEEEEEREDGEEEEEWMNSDIQGEGEGSSCASEISMYLKQTTKQKCLPIQK